MQPLVNTKLSLKNSVRILQEERKLIRMSEGLGNITDMAANPGVVNKSAPIKTAPLSN